MQIAPIHYKSIFIHILVPILVGTTIYALWRGINLVDMLPLLSSKPPEWIIYNLPDGLWFYALLSSIYLIWEENFPVHFILWLLITVILSCLMEVMQAYNFLNGTFDWKDLLAYMVAGIVSIFQFRNKRYRSSQLNSKK